MWRQIKIVLGGVAMICALLLANVFLNALFAEGVPYLVGDSTIAVVAVLVTTVVVIAALALNDRRLTRRDAQQRHESPAAERGGVADVSEADHVTACGDSKNEQPE